MVFKFVELLRNLGGMATPKAKGFPKTLTTSDFGITSDVTVKAGVWNTLGEFTVPAQQSYRFGIGDPAHPDNQGYIYMAIKDGSGNEIKGKVRLVYSDANGLNKTVIFEERNEVLSASKSDRKQMKPLPEIAWNLRPDGKAHEDDKLVIEYLPDSDATVSASNTEILIPVTQY